MKEQELRLVVEGDEGQRTEFKESFSEEREAIETLCAFAHSLGGIVVFGVKNDKSIRGVQLGKNTLENFANNLRRNTQPPLTAILDVVPMDGKDLVTASINTLPPDRVCFAFNCAFVRVGRTNQRMSPDDIRDRHFVGFRAEASASNSGSVHGDESWSDCEKRRVQSYEECRGLFLVHEWRPSEDPEQVADVVLYVRQHPGPDEPLTSGAVKSVEYHLGPKFLEKTIVKADADDNFRLEMAAYGPLLCLARVNFEDGHPSLLIQRYIDF